MAIDDKIRQILEVVTTEIEETTFNIYSNETYPSTFNLNTFSQVVYHSTGKLGEQPTFTLTVNGEITSAGVSLKGDDNAQIYNNVECQVIINIPTDTQGYASFNKNMSIVSAELGGLPIRFATPYNFGSGAPTFKQLNQVPHTQDAVNGITYTMKCFITISKAGNITFIVDEDNLDDVEQKPVDETYTVSSAMWSDLSGNTPYKYMASVTATYTIGDETEVGIINDQPVAFANYGFVVGSVSNQTVVIFAIDKPTAEINLSVRYRG